MLNILFIGEINGQIGRQAVARILPGLKKEFKPDLVIANADNLAHGNGVSESTLKEMMAAGVDWFTGGDHCFGNTAYLNLYDSDLPLLRPANYAAAAPGRGQAIIDIHPVRKQSSTNGLKSQTTMDSSNSPISSKVISNGVNGHKILLVSLIGQVFMPLDFNNPFAKADEILSNLANKNISGIIVDIHAEATSEKIALFHYLDARVSAILGTHTHIMTADAQISKAGTALITDVGMTGFADGVLGVEKEGIIKTFLTQIKYPHVIPETGRAIFNSVALTIDPATKKTIVIKPITRYINII